MRLTVRARIFAAAPPHQRESAEEAGELIRAFSTQILWRFIRRILLGGDPQGRWRTCWRDEISLLVLECLEIRQQEREDVSLEGIAGFPFSLFLDLMPQGPD